MKTLNELINAPADCIASCSRIFNTTPELAFKAWTDPKHLQKWWGPNGFTNTFKVFDLQPGGKWSFIMHGPKDDHYDNESVFIKIEPNKLIAFLHISPPKFYVLTTFEEQSDTMVKVTFRMIFDSPEECNKLKDFVKDKNEENMDRLEKELAIMGS